MGDMSLKLVSCSSFLKIVDVVDGTAECIEEAIRAYTTDKELAFSKLMGFGSDGASVMTGRLPGVATRLHRRNPYLVAIHCVAGLGLLTGRSESIIHTEVQESTDLFQASAV